MTDDREKTLVELAERCEVASGPDRELEVLIASATGYRNRFTGELLSEWLNDPERRDEAMRWDGIAFYSRSLDAAIGLVPEGHGWSVTCDKASLGPEFPPAQGNVYPDAQPFPVERDIYADAATPALALTAAALKARALQEQQG